MADTYKGSITLASVEDGRDESEQIIVQSSDETIYKFYTSEGFKEYSPESVSFWVQQRGETYGEEVSGDVISFETDIAAPLDSAKVTLTPKQDLNGYDKPWPAGGGVNKLRTTAQSKTEKGVTWTVNADGTITVSGTATGYTQIEVGRASVDSSMGNITVSGLASTINIVWASVQVRDVNSNVLYTIAINGRAELHCDLSQYPDAYEVVVLVKRNNNIATSGTVKIQVEKGTTASSWSPYSNVCPITGTEEVTVARTGVNVWDEEWEVGYIRVADGSDAPGTNNIRSKNYIPVIPSAEYYLHSGLSTAIYCPLIFYDENKNFVSAVVQQVWNRTIIIPSNAYFVRFYMGSTYGTTYRHDISINYPSTDHVYHAYNGETVTTDLGRTIYGGSVDLVSGVLTVTHKSVTPPSSDYANNGKTGTLYEFSLNNLTDKAAGSTNFICSNMMVSANRAEYSARGRDTGQTISFCLPISVANNITSARAWVDSNPIQTVYELATPETYQLTPQQVSALLGANTIWSDAGQIDIIYPKKDGTIVRPTSNLIPDVDYDHELELVGTSVEDYKNLWSFFGRIYGTLNADETTQSTQVLNLVRTISNNQVIFNIDNLNNLAVDEGRTSSTDVTLFNSLQSQLSGSNYFFNFKVYKPTNNDPPLAIDLIDYKPIGVEFGTSDDMAQFSLTATSIQQLVRDTKLTFDAQGLHLENGAFDITDTRYHLASPSAEEFDANKTSYYTYDTETGKYIQCTSSSTYNASTQYYTSDPLELLAYDPNLHTLRVNGNGKFTGTIEATDGSFTGHVVATSGSFTGTVAAQEGEIGGWVIRNDGLYSRATGDNKPSIELLSEGTINAQTINLGTGAHINDFIQLGENAVLYNPDEHTGKVLSLGNPESISLYNNGLFQLGNITLDGENSIIKGNNWSIDPDFARFRNVEVSGKISSAVFETASVSAVGGIMLFKTAYKVESFSGRNIVLDIKYSGNVGDSVYLTNSDGQLSELMTVDAINEKQVMLAEAIPFTEVISLIQIGNINNRPIIIGVNSTDVNAGFLSYQGITISEVYKEGNNIKNDIKAFLGNLQSLNIQGVTGYGLYGSNVYLTGSLTTQVQGLTTSYAGINTLNGANATKFDNDTSKIVFWAGSEGITNEQIAAAPFQVTENGSIYASRGIFEGSIISRSTIEGSVIKTARIEGSGTNPALKILDAINGIGFYTVGANDQDIEAFTIGSDGFKIGNNHFISISNNSIDFNGRNITIDSLYTRNVGGITLAISRNKIESKYGNVTTPSITFKTNSIDLTVQSTDSKFSVTESLTSLNTDLVEMKKNIAYGNIMKYERVENQNGNENGYDLYVY